MGKRVLMILVISALLVTACGKSTSQNTATSSLEGAYKETAEKTESVTSIEKNAETQAVDSQVLSEEPGDQIVEYVQDEVVIADNDEYKLTVTGYDPDTISKFGAEVFLVYFNIENKTDTEYDYEATDGFVNHADSQYYGTIHRENNVSPGEDVDFSLMILYKNLQLLNISRIDALTIGLSAHPSDERYTGTKYYTFSPTGKDCEKVVPAVDFTDGKYEILIDNDVITLGINESGDWDLLSEDGYDEYVIDYFDLIVHSDKYEKARVVITDSTVDGEKIESFVDFGYFENYGTGICESDVFTNKAIMYNAFSIIEYEEADYEEGSVIQFTIEVDGLEGDEVVETLYKDTLTYEVK